MEPENVFKTLNAVNVNDLVEVKDIGPTKLTYLSWALCWIELKKRYPMATYKVYENTLPNGYVVNYFTNGECYWVKTSVTVEGLEAIEMLPVMDNRNHSITADQVKDKSIDFGMAVQKAIQRCLTKASARHGLGLYVYAGEDLPDEEKARNRETAEADLPIALKEVKACKTNDDISNVWNKWKKIHPEYVKQGHEFFIAATSADVEFV